MISNLGIHVHIKLMEFNLDHSRVIALIREKDFENLKKRDLTTPQPTD